MNAHTQTCANTYTSAEQNCVLIKRAKKEAVLHCTLCCIKEY